MVPFRKDLTIHCHKNMYTFTDKYTNVCFSKPNRKSKEYLQK